MSSYTPGTIARSATILANTGADLPTLVALIAAAQNRSTTLVPAKPVKRTPIAPEAGINAEPSIAQRVPSTKVEAWRKFKPSKPQIARNRSALAQINRMESILGYRLSTFQALNNGHACKFNAGAYSDFFQNTLKPLAASLTKEATQAMAR